jgi:hypothetical protein
MVLFEAFNGREMGQVFSRALGDEGMDYLRANGLGVHMIRYKVQLKLGNVIS